MTYISAIIIIIIITTRDGGDYDNARRRHNDEGQIAFERDDGGDTYDTTAQAVRRYIVVGTTTKRIRRPRPRMC